MSSCPDRHLPRRDHSVAITKGFTENMGCPIFWLGQDFSGILFQILNPIKKETYMIFWLYLSRKTVHTVVVEVYAVQHC